MTLVPGQLTVSRLSLRTKVLAITGLSGALVATILVAAFSVQMRGALEAELTKRARVAGVELAHNLASSVAYSQTESLQAAANATLRDVTDVAYVILRDAKGTVLARATDARLAKVDPVAPAIAEQVIEHSLLVDGVPVVEATVPLFFGASGTDDGSRVGTVQVALRLDTLDASIRSITWTAVGLGFLGLLGCLIAAAIMARLVITPLERLARAAAGIAAGDLRQQIDTTGGDEIGEVARIFAQMARTLTELIQDLRSAAADIEREATSVLGTSSRQSAMAHEQASAINETSTTVAEISQTSKQATAFADGVINGTLRSEELSSEGQKVVGESVAGMDKLGEQVKAIALAITELNERSVQIGDIISTVKDVAEQSNLLALNASVEAAKAGEHGRGFAVVATEMRTLAEQSRLAASQVRALLGEVQKGTRAAVSATEEGSRRASAAMALAQSAGTAILGLTEVIRESSAAARQIAGSARQQTIGVEQISAAMTELASAMADTVEGTRRIEQVAGNLSNLSKRFSELVGRYQL
ncbi:methyl-accepting chemotaxis protein [Myxococcaceae bacterium GXIMD 01537]